MLRDNADEVKVLGCWRKMEFGLRHKVKESGPMTSMGGKQRAGVVVVRLERIFWGAEALWGLVVTSGAVPHSTVNRLSTKRAVLACACAGNKCQIKGSVSGEATLVSS